MAVFHGKKDLMTERLKERISLCSDDSCQCPRSLAQSEEDLNKTAELWYRAGFRDRIFSAEEMKCGGCHSGKQCGYGLTDCTAAHSAGKCSQCPEFMCSRLRALLNRSKASELHCRKVCSPEEYDQLCKAFFRKEQNLKNSSAIGESSHR